MLKCFISAIQLHFEKNNLSYDDQFGFREEKKHLFGDLETDGKSV